MSTDADQRREWRVRRKQEVEAANKRHAAEDSAHDKLQERLAARSGLARGGYAPSAFPIVNRVCMGLLYGRAGRLTA